MTQAIQVLFIIAVPLVLVAGAIVALFGVGAFFDAVERPGELKRRVEGAFRRPPSPPRTTGPEHYYKPYWQSR